MNADSLKRWIIRFQKLSLMMHAFVPWPEYWNQNRFTAIDGSILQANFAKDCSKAKPRFHLEIARTDEARQKGLSNRPKQLKSDRGMIFIFEHPQPVSFWMKRTLIPLQIIYVDRSGKPFQTLEMPVEKDPENPRRFFPSSGPVTAAIEVAPKTWPLKTDHTLCVEMVKSR